MRPAVHMSAMSAACLCINSEHGGWVAMTASKNSLFVTLVGCGT